MPTPNVSKSQIAALFGCSVERLNLQYRDNLSHLRAMQKKAETTGKKLHGYTAKEWKKSADQFEQILAQNENTPIASIPKIQIF